MSNDKVRRMIETQGRWYVKKPIPVKAVRLEEEAIIETLEGAMRARPGDYVVQGVRGELYPVAEEIFEETYRECPGWKAPPKTVVVVGTNGSFFVELGAKAPLVSDFVVVESRTLHDAMSVCPTVKGLAAMLRFPATSERLYRSLGTLLCGLLRVPRLVDYHDRVFTSRVACPRCEVPMVPYDGHFWCFDCLVRVRLDWEEEPHFSWPDYALSCEPERQFISYQGLLFQAPISGATARLGFEAAREIHELLTGKKKTNEGGG